MELRHLGFDPLHHARAFRFEVVVKGATTMRPLSGLTWRASCSFASEYKKMRRMAGRRASRPTGCDRRGVRVRGLPVSSAMPGCVLSERACFSVCGETALYRH